MIFVSIVLGREKKNQLTFAHSYIVPPQDFEFQDWDELCDKLNTLATDCNKYRAKTDKRKQRSVFRDVLKAVEVSAKPPH